MKNLKLYLHLILLVKINLDTKTQRQLLVIQRWLDNNYIGTLVAATGFGKTYTTILVIKKLLELNQVYPKTIIVVPTLILKDHWISELNKHKIPAMVYVINTASKLDMECELLVIDEVHTAAAETFKLVFECIKYSKLFNLTATIERLDGLHTLLLEKAPIIDIITLKECLDNKWISPYQVYNLEVPFSNEEQKIYNKVDNAFKYYAMKLGYGNSFDTAKQWLANGTSIEKGIAGAYYNSMRKRKQLITENSAKIIVTNEIINKFIDSKYIVFSEAISFVDSLIKLNDTCVGIHSKMSKKLQKEAMNAFNDGRTKKRGIASCKALSAGLDIPELDLGIRASFNSSKLINIQSIGRILRISGDKQAKFINLFTPDSQEVNWLKKSQEGLSNIKFIKNISEII